MEIWLEPMLDGVILHYFLHAEPAGAAAGTWPRSNLAKITHHRRVAGKRMSFEIKNELEAARPGGDGPRSPDIRPEQCPGGYRCAVQEPPNGTHWIVKKVGSVHVADKTAQTIYIDADPGTVMDVIADIGSYPEWVKEYKETEVLDADDEGFPKTARLVLDAAVLKDTMVLEYEWPADRNSVRWSLVSSSLLKALDGAYRLSPKGSGTDVTYELSVDLMIPMIGLLKRKAERRLTDTALKDLKKRVEG